MKSQNIDIILPSRIGDSILSIPAIVALEQLSNKYGANLNIRVLSKAFLQPLFSTLGLFKSRSMGLAQKTRSVFFPADKAFFVETTNDNLGYRAKYNYGTVNEFKKLLKFQHSPEYLKFSFNPYPQTWDTIRKTFPVNLENFLVNECGLAWYSACLFGICLELGFTAEQIINTYKFTPDMVHKSAIPISKCPAEPYVVFCIEAGYGRKHLNERCWDISGYFKIAEQCAKDYGVKTVFIGKDSKTPLPVEDYIVDLRDKITIPELAGVMKSALLYIGNDTGPMHVANLMNTPSVAVYFRDEHMTGFNPVFPAINTKVFRPESTEPIYSEVCKKLDSILQRQ